MCVRLAFIGREFWVAEKLRIVIMSCGGHHESMLLLVCAMERRCRERAEKKSTGVVAGVRADSSSPGFSFCAPDLEINQLERVRVRSFQNKPHGPKTEDMLFVIIRWVRVI